MNKDIDSTVSIYIYIYILDGLLPFCFQSRRTMCSAVNVFLRVRQTAFSFFHFRFKFKTIRHRLKLDRNPWIINVIRSVDVTSRYIRKRFGALSFENGTSIRLSLFGTSKVRQCLNLSRDGIDRNSYNASRRLSTLRRTLSRRARARKKNTFGHHDPGA